MQTIYQYDSRNVFTGAQRGIKDAEGAPIGWTRLQPPELASGEFAIFSGRDGWRLVNEEPAFAPEPPTDDYTYKTDIWQRCTDDEAEILDGQLNQAPAKERRMWDDAQSVEHSSQYYGLLKAQMETTFGVDRTALILAPSSGV